LRLPLFFRHRNRSKALARDSKTETKRKIWTFCNKDDGGVSVESIRKTIQVVNGSGGFMKLTQFDQGGHAAWRPAMDEYNCFSWMIAQKRGGWFNPPPERKVYQSRSLLPWHKKVSGIWPTNFFLKRITYYEYETRQFIITGIGASSWRCVDSQRV
jgi:hypothetical protein